MFWSPGGGGGDAASGGKGGPKMTFTLGGPECWLWPVEYREKKSKGPAWHIRLVSPILGPRQRPPASGLQGAGPQAEAGPLAQHMEQAATCWWCSGGAGKEHGPQLLKKKKKKNQFSSPALFLLQKSQSPYFQFGKTKTDL